MLTVFTGPLAAPLVPGQRLKLSWRLLLTPVRYLLYYFTTLLLLTLLEALSPKPEALILSPKP